MDFGVLGCFIAFLFLFSLPAFAFSLVGHFVLLVHFPIINKILLIFKKKYIYIKKTQDKIFITDK
jgi:hypothetical protein